MNEPVFEEIFENFKFQIFKKRPEFDFSEVKQVHGSLILEDSLEDINESEADGIFSLNLSKPIAIKTADCLPIAVIGKHGVALLHAGWRGVHQKIVQSSILGKLEPEFFYIGPHIQRQHFEVQNEFKENFPGSHHFEEVDDKLYFNLSAEVSEQIHESFPKAKILVSGLSTFNDDRFFSYRLNKTSDRNWNLLSKLN